MSHALDLILTGRGVQGDEALRMGIANRLVEPGEADRPSSPVVRVTIRKGTRVDRCM